MSKNRIMGLVDENSFVELGGSVTARSTDFAPSPKKEGSDGVVVGHGLVDGNLVFLYSQDPDVLNGTMGEMHAKKILGIYDMAMKVGAPVIGMLDTKGLRIEESMDAAEALGAVAAKAATASGIIPVITAVFGNLGGGMAALAGLSDFTLMAEDAHLFFNSPDALPENSRDKCDPSSAKEQLKGAAVDFIGSESEVLGKIRELICLLPGSSTEEGRTDVPADDANRGVSLAGKESDMGAFVAELADAGSVFEVKPGFATDMFTGLIRLNGSTTGVVANAAGEGKSSAKLTVDGCRKAADFVRYCDAFDIPLLVITNVDGFEVSMEAEYGLSKALSSYVTALSNADVAKISLVINASSTAYIYMNAKSMGADFVYAYADSKVEVLEAGAAADILCENGMDTATAKADYIETQCGVANAARRGFVDRILNREDTRKYLIDGFEILFTKSAGTPYKKHESR